MVDSKYLSVKILVGAIQYAASQLVDLDPEFKKMLAGIDSITQWKVAPSGPNSYTIVKNQKIESKMDAVHNKPTYTLVVKDLNTALDLFQAKIDAKKALTDGSVKVSGDAAKAQKEIFILEKLGQYLGDLRG